MSEPSQPHKPNSFIGSVNCAIEGILWAARTQRHMLVHLVAAVLVMFGALFMGLGLLEFALLALAITLVLFAELMNTALEVIVDLVSPDYHILAQRAKDVAAGAVLVASVGAVVLGYLAVSRYLFGHGDLADRDLLLTTGNLAVVAVVLVSIGVVLLKARIGRGTPLAGGMPSGHAGVAFSIATSIAFADVSLLVVLLSYGLAAIVAHSRVLLGVHNLAEVVAGALLGIGVTLVLYWLFH